MEEVRVDAPYDLRSLSLRQQKEEQAKEGYVKNLSVEMMEREIEPSECVKIDAFVMVKGVESLPTCKWRGRAAVRETVHRQKADSLRVELIPTFFFILSGEINDGC